MKAAPNFDTDVLEPLRQAQAEQAKKEAEAAAEAARKAEEARQADLQATAGKMQPFGTYNNNYAFGNCTSYVASRISVPNSMGDARNWAFGLPAAGFREGGPRRGAIGVSGVGWAGHVVAVESVDGDAVTISEMNFNWGFDQVDTRVVSASDFRWFF